MNAMKSTVAIATLFLLLFGCINLDFLGGGKPSPAGGNGSAMTSDSEPNATGNVIITSHTNTSVIHNASINDTGPPKPPGIKYTETPDSMFAVYFIYVGSADNQGDAILIKKGDAEILVDAGPDKKAAKIIDFLKSKKVDDIELLISTHADPEHYNGISVLSDSYDVESFWWMGGSFENKDYVATVSKINAKGIPVAVAAKGDTLTINGMKLSVLNPPKETEFAGTEGADNNAIVLKMSDRSFCLLLTSDILYGAQTKLATTADVKCDIMQMPYHGLGIGNSQIDTFLLKVMPKHAVISGGPSEPGADDKGSRFALYERLKLRGIKYYTNFLNGTVKIISDGATYAVQYEK